MNVSSSTLFWLGIANLALGAGLLAFGTLFCLNVRNRLQRSIDETRRLLQTGIKDLEKGLHESQKEKKRVLNQIRASLIELRTPQPLAVRKGETSNGLKLDKKHQLSRLAERGLPPDEIARKLHLYQGETELFLGLQQFTSAGGRS